MRTPFSSPDLSVAPSLPEEIDELKRRLAEAEETLLAIRQGEVDAVVVKGAAGPQVYTLLNADRPYRNIVERMQEGAFTLTMDGIVLYANQRLASFLGLSPSNIVGQKLAQFISANDQELFNRILAQGSQSIGKGELALCAVDGPTVPVYLSVINLPDEGQQIISGIVTDLRWQKQQMRELAEVNAKLVAAMTERERVESMLRQAHKMEAIGQLTAGIAHDFNNLLLVISGNLELFHARITDDWLRRRVEAGQRAVQRGAGLTQQLLAFARCQKLRPHPTSVNALLLDIEPLLRSSVGGSIKLSLVLDDGSALCLVDSTELQAAILNLAMNAKDAMPQGGSLTITTENVEFAGPADGDGGLAQEQCYLSIVMTDTGHGMTPQIRDRAFDPFFTTKDVGKGTGLGLSRIHGFMHQSGGHVTIDSTPDIGTSVRLYLPRTEVPAKMPEPTMAVEVASGTPLAHRILVVEDDQSVRDLVIEVLESLGYAAIAAESGSKALSLLDSGIVVDAILSDVLMPDGMSGFQLAREIQRRLPHLAIVLTSGMTAISGNGEDEIEGLPILRKPYRSADLSQAIEAALGATSPE